ncbi:uncharacterized protein A4U43_C06F990 [Asparagus officinalis]|uniref:non-specific serine/threonine protein kinase n=1 Tax=Asparagus officinalis TaxID=4686 RepID=A0A5P1ELW4_ASPOF|nr:uncharacterized protein A4U43_C06F990 [Asparagus officinalis]
MQGHFNPHHHHQIQQQLASLLSAALAQSTTSSVAGAEGNNKNPSNNNGAVTNESSRVSALESLRRTIVGLYPINSLVLSHSASFLSHGLFQLLSDKSYAVRRAAAVAYGCLCAVLASTSFASNGLQNHVLITGLVDRFISWALPLLGDIGARNRLTEIALESLHEFLNVGDASSVERYVPSILTACQEVIEDERTSLRLLQQLLVLLNLISVKFESCLQPHFVDIVDVLLGWAFMPELSVADRCVITNSFLQFQKQWVSNLHFSMGLLSKFLGDMETLIQDTSLHVNQQFGRLFALFSCFSTVLKVTASGILEMNLLEQISDPIENIASRFLRFVSSFGSKFGWSNWIGESWNCFILLAEILQEKFSHHYPMVISILFESMRTVSSSQVLGLLKTNTQLLSLQKMAVLSSSVQTLLQFDSPLSQLRLHMNHLVVASTVSVYLFFLRHACDKVVSQAVMSLLEEVESLKGMLGERRYCNPNHDGVEVESKLDGQLLPDSISCKYYSENDLISLIKFDLKLLLCSVSVRSSESSFDDNAICERLTTLSSFMLETLNPFKQPIQGFLELQVHVVSEMHKLSEVEFLAKLTSLRKSSKSTSGILDSENQRCIEIKEGEFVLVVEYLRKYSSCLIRAFDGPSPLGVKLEALYWIRTFGRMVSDMNQDKDLVESSCSSSRNVTVCSDLLFLVLDAAYDRELNLRSLVASVLEVLLEAMLINAGDLCYVSVVALDKLGDPDVPIRNLYLRVFSIVLPLTMYTCGFHDGGDLNKLGAATEGNRCYINWKKVLALNQLPCRLHSQQLVSILSYISQRWKVPLSSWIQRLVFSCRGKRELTPSPHEVVLDHDGDGLQKDAAVVGEMLEKMCPVSNLAAIWWSIHEAARYCINLRLRTNLGGPTQTFAAFERMLLDIPHVLLHDAEQTEGKYMGSYNYHLLPMRLLLELVEALKKNVYNAYEGSCVLPCSPRQSSLFFRANRKVCEEWFSRICEPMMNAGLALHCHDATLHYCTLRLQDLRNLAASALKEKTRGAQDSIQNLRPKLAADVLKVLRHTSLALCRKHESEALVGLQNWAAVTFRVLFVEDDQVGQGVSTGSGQLSWMDGLVYQAQGHYEKAAAHFSHLLQSETSLSSLGSDGIQFVIARVIESYTSLSDWKSLEIWLTELQALRAVHAGRTYSGALTAAGNELNAVHALARFDEGDINAAWGYLDLTPKSSNELTLDPKIALERSEQMLLRSMLQRDSGADKIAEDVKKARLMLDEALSLVPLDGVSEAAACAVQLHCISALEESLGANGVNGSKRILGSLNQVLNYPIRRIRQDCSLWIKVFRVYRTLMPTSAVTPLLCEKLLSLSRKQKNFLLADRMNKYRRDHLLRYSSDKHKETFSTNLEYEGILLKYAEGKHEEALTDIWSLVRSTVLSSGTFASDISNVLKAKACLKLSTWLRQEKSNITLVEVLSKIRKNFSGAFDGSFTAPELPLSDSNLFSDAYWKMILEEIVGTTTKISCKLCPTMGKTWLSYSSWCFSQAKSSFPLHETVLKSCLLSPVLNPEVSSDRFQLTEEEMSKVKSIVMRAFHNSTSIETVVDDESRGLTVHPKSEALVNSLVQQTVHLMQAAAGAPGLEASNGECSSAALTSQLQVLFFSMDANLKKSDLLPFVDELIGVWWSLRRRRVALFGYAAHGYFQYLSHSSSKLDESHSSTFHPDAIKRKAPSSSLQAMLYLLHILLNYGVELKETFECGFATVPLLPWQEITPQLFARLSSHPKEAVRKQLEGLLMMLAKLSPWSIVYPLLVDINAYEGEPSEELQRILASLAKLYPKLIQDVQLVINGLGKITVLWEEQWLNTLQDLHGDVIRRIHMLKEEAARIAENPTLSNTEKKKINAAKYSAMMAPIIVALERRLASTSREPETAHEAWFCKEYGDKLKSAILAFKTPPGEVAPQLASLSSSEVPMPGLEKQISMLNSSGTSGDVQGIISISSFCEHMTILSTKTKPKKLVLLGSDGQKHTYLLKGQEDLRLDARIMQLLQAVNSFLNSCSDTLSRSLTIRYYSVTPISGQAGLIQWVDNVTSLYSIYKSWQIRVQLAAAGAGNTDSHASPVPRPSDMFYGKIIPALKEKGIRRVISRRDWPHEVKRKVLLDLMKETPRQLLWQEMWCASEGFRGFSLKTRRFSSSVAAMSMVGHILGLGDRHLDNILMDFCSGDVIHIDYNVCFDKGKRLKIPEIVPFRLTQIIETALGLTGIEGSFRANCEAVIEILRKNKDILLMLLEVFVWDPLVEWTRGDNHILLMLLEVFVWDPLVEWTRGDNHDEAAIGGEEKKGMELAVSLSLFASRFQEIRIPLQEHRDLLVSTLPAAESALRNFLDVLNQYEIISTIFYHADKEKSSLLQHEASAKSIVAEATAISEKSRVVFEAQAQEFGQAKAVAAEKAQEATIWVDQHGRVLDALRTG